MQKTPSKYDRTAGHERNPRPELEGSFEGINFEGGEKAAFESSALIHHPISKGEVNLKITSHKPYFHIADKSARHCHMLYFHNAVSYSHHCHTSYSHSADM